MQGTQDVRYRVIALIAVAALAAALVPHWMSVSRQKSEMAFQIAQKDREIELLKKLCPHLQAQSTSHPELLALQNSMITPPKTLMSADHTRPRVIQKQIKQQPPKKLQLEQSRMSQRPVPWLKHKDQTAAVQRHPMHHMPLDQHKRTDLVSAPTAAGTQVTQPTPLSHPVKQKHDRSHDAQLSAQKAKIARAQPQWVAPGEHHYVIRVASFAHDASAQKMVKQLQAIGLDARTQTIHRPEKGQVITRVVIEDSMNPLQAKQLVAELYDRYQVHAMMHRV